MGCGCGGSTTGTPAAAGAPGEKPKRGPGSEGYYWSGPVREHNGPSKPERPAAPEQPLAE